MSVPKKKRGHRAGAGFTIPHFAEHFGMPESQVRLAVKRGEIRAVVFAGLARIPPSEAERVATLFGKTPRGASPNQITKPAADEPAVIQ